MSVADVADEVFVGLRAGAESDPAKKDLKQRACSALILTLIIAVQLLWWSGFGYAAYLFFFSY
jgi:hypothetical protein